MDLRKRQVVDAGNTLNQRQIAIDLEEEIAKTL